MESLTDVFLIILGLMVLWFILRFLLRLTAKIFSCGCGTILAIGIFLAILRIWQS